MDIFSESFIDYENSFTNLELIREADFYLTSPDSTSTKTKTHSLSPELQSSFLPNEQLPLESTSCIPANSMQRSDSPPEDSSYLLSINEEKISSKSKRITKRNAAKERTKTRQNIEGASGINDKWSQEDPNSHDLDENTKKKMALKMKNRIAAQNSRDRKKIFTQQLQEMNTKLVEENISLQREKEILMDKIAMLQRNEMRLTQEIESLKNRMICSSCKQGYEMSHHDQENNNNHYSLDYENSGRLSNLSSPILARFPSAGRKIFTFLTFVCFIAIILLVNVNHDPPSTLIGQSFKDRGLLEFKNDICENSKELDVESDQSGFSRQNSLLGPSIELLKDHLGLSSESLRHHEAIAIGLTDNNPNKLSKATQTSDSLLSKSNLLLCPNNPKFRGQSEDNAWCPRESSEGEVLD